jgi:hypothetical protein
MPWIVTVFLVVGLKMQQKAIRMVYRAKQNVKTLLVEKLKK